MSADPQAGLLREAAERALAAFDGLNAVATWSALGRPEVPALQESMTALRAALAVAQDPAQPWKCDWQPDDLNPIEDGCPYCAGRMCARFDGLGCTHGREERHGYPALPAQEERLDVATWRLSNAASSLARHAAHADDPAHRSWFPSAIADVEREVRLARAAAGPEPDYTAAKGSRHDP